MRLEKLGKLELTYTDIDTEIPYEAGGQVYGVLTGSIEAGELRGTIHATNLARQRPDGAFTPRLRGLVTTPEGIKVFFAMDGLSIKETRRGSSRRRVTAGITFWTADPRLRRWNDEYIVTEMEGRAMGDSWGVVGSLYRCVAEL